MKDKIKRIITAIIPITIVIIIAIPVIRDTLLILENISLHDLSINISTIIQNLVIILLMTLLIFIGRRWLYGSNSKI